MYTKVSDSVAVDVVKKLERQVQEMLPRHKGHFIKSTGDGQLLTFDEAPGALRTAAEIHRLCDILAREKSTDLFVRIAAHTGEVFHGDGDIHGNTVNLTARLLTVTGACETCVTAEAWASMPEDLRKGFVVHGPEVFKGFTKFSFVYKKPNPNPFTDVTIRPESTVGEDETTMLVTDSMPHHNQYALALEHPQIRKTILVKEGETHVIGRAPECTTVIPDRMFSGTHAAFAVVEGICWAFDLQSSNGIMYKGRRVKRRKPLELNSKITLPVGHMDVKLP